MMYPGPREACAGVSCGLTSDHGCGKTASMRGPAEVQNTL
jgi:hypothetical protein